MFLEGPIGVLLAPEEWDVILACASFVLEEELTCSYYAARPRALAEFFYGGLCLRSPESTATSRMVDVLVQHGVAVIPANEP